MLETLECPEEAAVFVHPRVAAAVDHERVVILPVAAEDLGVGVSGNERNQYITFYLQLFGVSVVLELAIQFYGNFSACKFMNKPWPESKNLTSVPSISPEVRTVKLPVCGIAPPGD